MPRKNVSAIARKNPRKAKLDAVSGTLARFMFLETYADEHDAQAHLVAAIKSLDAAAKLLVESDDRAALTGGE